MTATCTWRTGPLPNEICGKPAASPFEPLLCDEHQKAYDEAELERGRILRQQKAVLALDLATDTGWALKRPDGRVESGHIVLTPKKTEGEGARFIKFSRFLIDTNERCEIGQVFFEDIVFNQMDQAYASQIFGGLKAVLLMFVEKRRIPIAGFAPTTVKKRFAGSGRAQKHDMVNQCHVLGFTGVKNHNEADAIGVLHVGTDTCPLLTMNGASPKKRTPRPQPEMPPGMNPF